REIRRHMNSRAMPVALPSGPIAPVVPDGKPAARPVAGPVVPLTVGPGSSEELLGGGGNSAPHGDAIATRVLVKGEPIPAPAGRADNFALQRGGDADLPPAAAPAESLLPTPADASRAEPVEAPPEKKAAVPKSGSSGKTTQTTQTTQTTAVRPRPKQDDVPRPPRGLFPSGGNPFSFFR
ncbi:MAG TPA: hypothetical protein VMT72_20410, partial [Pseudolabrys sp.]|nr:hypothetical protein [Pseudolabrys sp.]